MESNLKKHRSNPKGLQRTHENHIFIAFVSTVQVEVQLHLYSVVICVKDELEKLIYIKVQIVNVKI